MRLTTYEMLRTIINTLLAIIAFFLILRVIFELFSLNVATPLVGWVFSISSLLMAPFAGLVPNITVQTGAINLVAIITLLAYAFLAYLLVSLIARLTTLSMTDEAVEEEEGYPRTASYHEVRRKRRRSSFDYKQPK